MENSEIYSENKFQGAYNELICEDDLSTDGQPLYQDQKPARVGSSSGHCRLVAACLGLLSALLLVVDIALAVHYSNIRNGQLELYHNFTQISSELKQLGIDHFIRINVKEQWEERLNELSDNMGGHHALNDAEDTRSELMKKIDDLQEEKTQLQSHISQLGQSCNQCLPGWELLNSICYYFSFSDTIGQKGWIDSRNDCIKKAADLAIIDTWEKQELISKVIFEQYTSAPMHMSGFWIGLTDTVEEGSWTWRNGTKLDHGYWQDGEPNDDYVGEDCAAVYPIKNSVKNWNDAPCRHPLKWICEKAPRKSA